MSRLQWTLVLAGAWILLVVPQTLAQIRLA
jgi:hypothetical protein